MEDLTIFVENPVRSKSWFQSQSPKMKIRRFIRTTIPLGWVLGVGCWDCFKFPEANRIPKTQAETFCDDERYVLKSDPRPWHKFSAEADWPNFEKYVETRPQVGTRKSTA